MDKITQKLGEIYELLKQMPYSGELKEQLDEEKNYSTIFEYMRRMLAVGNQCDEILEEVDKELEEQPIGKEEHDKLEVIEWTRRLTTLIKQDLRDDDERGAINVELLLRIDEYSNNAKGFYEDFEKRKGHSEMDITPSKTLEKLEKLKKSEKQMDELNQGLENIKNRRRLRLKDIKELDGDRRKMH